MNITDINSIEDAREAGREIWRHYGRDKQLTKLMEELAELIIEISRMINFDERYSLENVIEEIADVEFMLMQVKERIKINQNDIDAKIIYKARRTINKINKEKDLIKAIKSEENKR